MFRAQVLVSALVAGAALSVTRGATAQSPAAVALELRATPRESLDPLINRLTFAKSTDAALAIAQMLTDPVTEVRVKAAYVLGYLDEPAAAPRLVEALGDRDWEVRRHAVYALGRLGHRRAAPELARRLADDHRSVRLQAAQTLAQVGTKAQGPALRRALTTAGDDLELQVAFLAALGAVGDTGAVPVLKTYATGNSETLRLAALRSLLVLGDGWARQRAVSQLDDAEAYARIDAVRLLAEVTAPWSVRALEKALDDPQFEVRLAAAEGLGRQGQKKGVTLLVELVDGADSRAALAAADALTRLEVPEKTRQAIRAELAERVAVPTPPRIDPAGLWRATQSAPFEHRLLTLSEHLKGLPYLDSPLGEGAGVDPDPLVRWDAVDCLTYVEQVLAYANAPAEDHALPALLDLRYSDGRASFGTRNHLMMAQWIPNNVAKGYLRDITREVGGEGVITVTKTLDAQTWDGRRGADLPLRADEIPLGTAELPLIPIAAFPEVMAKVPSGTVLIVVRRDKSRRPYRVTHLGFVVHRDGTAYLRHAARAGYQKVVDERLDTFVRRNANYRKWPVEGFSLLLPVENTGRARKVTAPSPSAASRGE